jgi:hypothetical protein
MVLAAIKRDYHSLGLALQSQLYKPADGCHLSPLPCEESSNAGSGGIRKRDAVGSGLAAATVLTVASHYPATRSKADAQPGYLT